MAVHTGSEGTIKVGANAIGELRSYSLTEEAETIEKSAMGDSYRSFSVGMKSWSGSCEVFWDETDTAQTALVPGASATIEFYPEGASSGDTYYHGTGIVNSVEKSASFDGMVEATISLTGSGGITTATV
jgi:hypothetical protein